MTGTKQTERDLYLMNPEFVQYLIDRTGLDPEHQTNEAIVSLYVKWTSGDGRKPVTR